MIRARLAFAFAPFAMVFAACGGDDDPTGTAADTFIREYCNLTAKCCDADQGNDPAACADAFSQFNTFFPRSYDAAKGTSCLAKLREATSCEFSEAQSDCDDVFGDASKSGSTPPGGACQSSSNCAASAEGSTSCQFSAASKSICQLRVPGTEGAACDGTRSGAITSWSGSGFSEKSRVVICDKADGLICNASDVCFRPREPGAACDTSQDCQSQLCSSSVCIARAEIGASCEKTSCVDTAFCEAMLCVAKRAPGAACTTFGQCKNGDCMNGVCQSFSTSPPLGCYSSGN